MGQKNYRIDGVSCSGKTTVGRELQLRGYQVIHGDDELAGWHEGEWVWDIEKVRALAANQNHAVTFFVGGSRNSDTFLDLFDEVFVLDIDDKTLNQRLAARPSTEWGGTASGGEAFARLQQKTKVGLPANAFHIDATAPLSSVVDRILESVSLVAIEADLPGILVLDRHIDEPVLRRKVAAHEVFVLREGPAVVATLRWSLFWDNTPFMNLLFVRADRQKRGLGSRLVQLWEDAMRRQGHGLVLTSTQANENAQHFYRKLGYADMGGFVLPREPLEILFFKEI